MCSTTDFLQAVLPEDGVYFAVQPYGDDRWRHTPVHDIDSLAAACVGISDEGTNAYFALASYQQPWYTDDTGRRRVRTKANVAALRAFWLDLDVGPAKPFPTQAAAARALLDFITVAELPAPTFITSSGYGLHCYWALKQSIPRAAWEGVAGYLAAAARAHGLHVDTHLTTNCAAILRPVGTANWKDADNPRPVRVLRQGVPVGVKTFLAAVRAAAGTEAPKTRSSGAKAASSDLAGGLEHPPSDAHRMADRCAVFGHMRDTLGADQQEPEWSACLMVLAASQQGEALCHEWSSGHPGYTEEETNAKLAYFAATYPDSPTRCETMREKSPHCDGCPHTVAGPIVLGYPDPVHQAQNVETGEVFPLPTSLEGRYAWSPEKGLKAKVQKRDKDGNVKDEVWVTCCRQYPMVDFIFFDPITLEFWARIQVWVRPGEWFSGDVRLAAVGQGGPALMRDLAGNLGLVPLGDPKLLVTFVQTWVDETRRGASLQDVRVKLGWEKRDSSFVLGSRAFKNDGTVESVVPSKALSKYVLAHEPRGSLERYTEIIDTLYNRPGHQQYQFVWVSSFASVLLHLVHHGTVGIPIVAYSSDSGLGKTSVAMAAISVWGDPNEHGQKAAGDGATELGFMTMAGQRRNLPVLQDETTTWPAERIAKFAYSYASGTAKIQARAEGGLRDTSNLNWTNFCYLTSNRSVIETMRGTIHNAGPQISRVFEVRFDPIVVDKQNYKLFEELWTHTGVAGPEFLKYVVPRGAEIRAKIEQVRDHLMAKLHLGTDARFWLMTAATTLVAFDITRKLGLHAFPLKPFLLWIEAKLKSLRLAALDAVADARDTLQEMISDTMRGLIVTLADPKPLEKVSFAPGYAAPTAATGRVILSTGDLFFPVSTIKRWCAERNYDMGLYKEGLQNCGLLVDDARKYYIGKGTNVPSTQARCWHIKWPDVVSHLAVVSQSGGASAGSVSRKVRADANAGAVS